MAYNFPRVTLTEPEKIWLDAVYSKLLKGQTIETRALKVELWDKLPKTFDPLHIDQRLVLNGGRDITLLGILHIDADSAVIRNTDRVILCIRDLLLEDHTRREFSAEEVATLTAIPRNDVARIFESFLHQLGPFQEKAWNLSEAGVHIGYERIGFERERAFDAYLRYEGIEDLLHRRYKFKEEHQVGFQALRNEMTGSLSGTPEVKVSLSKFGIPDHISFKTYLIGFSGQEPTSCIFMDLDNFKP